MKTIGIQIESHVAILVVLEKNEEGVISQTRESIKFKIADANSNEQVKQFRDQINVAFDAIAPDHVGILARKATGRFAASGISFKLEGIMQLNAAYDISFVAPKTIKTFLANTPCDLEPFLKGQQEAFDLAFYLVHQNDENG